MSQAMIEMPQMNRLSEVEKGQNKTECAERQEK